MLVSFVTAFLLMTNSPNIKSDLYFHTKQACEQVQAVMDDKSGWNTDCKEVKVRGYYSPKFHSTPTYLYINNDKYNEGFPFYKNKAQCDNLVKSTMTWATCIKIDPTYYVDSPLAIQNNKDGLYPWDIK